MDTTCGALPFGPAPNNYSLGLHCSTDSNCQFAKCVPAITCFCCANISILCSSNSDCQQYEKDSYCGCVLGGTGICGPYFDVLTGNPVVYDIFTGSYPPRVQVRFFLNSLPFVYFEYPTRSYSAFFILAAKGSCMHLLVSTHNSVSNK